MPPLSVHHIGVAVPSIEDAMHFYGEKMGLDIVDRLELPDRQLKVAFVQADNTLIELLEPTDPDATVARFLERRGPGLHHLCFGTPDILEHLRDLRDKGVELIDEAALQEDVDAIGLSILSGAHMTLFPRIMDELKKRGLDDVLVWAGGIIPEADVPRLKEIGIRAVFGPGSPTSETIDFLRRATQQPSAAVEH